jgi:membrane protease YdiL (CAAX protease family)
MRRKSNYAYLVLLIILYFLLDFAINFILIKLLGGYDNKINYDLSVIYSRLFVVFIFIIAIIINRKIFNYLKFRKTSIKKAVLFLGGSVIYSFVIIFIKNQNITEYSFHWSQNNNYFLLSAIFVAPFYEEIINKGLPIEYLIKKNVSTVFITIFISILFSLSHLPSIEGVFYALILGIITSLIYIKERNLIYPMIFHFVYNFIVLCIY